MNLTHKVGPLPVWAWVGIGAVGIIAGLWLRNRAGQGQSAASASTTGAPALDTTGSIYPDFGSAVGGSGGGSGVASAPAGIDPTQYVSDVFAARTAGATDAISFFGQGLQTAESFFTSPGGGYGTPSGLPPSTTPGQTGDGRISPSGWTPTAPIPSSTTTSLGKAAGPLFGGIVSTKTGKGGVKITTYGNGRVVEQAPGKHPYVAKKGG